MKSFKVVVLYTASFLVFVFAGNSALFSADLIVYLKPNGDNSADGLTKESAVASLQTAIDYAIQKSDLQHDRLLVVVAPGVYFGQSAVTKGPQEGKQLIISPEKGEVARPKFDGSGKVNTWLKLNNSSGKPTRLTVEGLEITNYLTAISLNGSRDSEATSNSHNVIRNNVFRNIGQIANPAASPSTAALRLVNSDENQIIKNHFLNIRNTNRCGALHAIYIAHYSTGNRIAENVFDGGCGATIKTRDRSSNNVIVNNRFANQEEPLFIDSFCNNDLRDDCTKEEAECPSWNNQFQENTMSRLSRKASTSPVKAIGSMQPSGCPSPQRGWIRVKQAGNFQR